jgi:glycosyltransferase involved in cell wall biosynthesis
MPALPQHVPPLPDAAAVCCIAPGHRAHHMRVYHKICRALAEGGFKVSLIAHDDAERDDGRVTLRPLGTAYRNYFTLNVLTRLSRSAQAFAIARRSGAVLFIYHSPEFIPWAALLRVWCRKPVIFDCMEDFEGYIYERQGLPPPLQALLRTATRRLLWLAAKTTDAVILSDRGTERRFKAFGASTLVVHNFPRLELFPSVTVEKDFDLVYHGTLRPSQIGEFLAIDDWLVKHGRTPRWYLFGHMLWSERLREELIRRGAARRFHLEGPIPHAETARAIARARIGIIPLPDMPKYQNNIPMKLFEYMAVGIPVVMSDLPPSRTFVENSGAAIMVPPSDFASFGRAIDRLLQDPQARAAMGARGRRRSSGNTAGNGKPKRCWD